MATLIEQQLYSQNHWTDIDGIQTIWNFSFSGGYIQPGHVKAYYLEGGENVTVPVTEDMLIGEFQLQVIPPVPATADRFVIYRDTPKDMPLVDFIGGARQTERNLDRISRQAVFCAAEVLDSAKVLLAPDLSALGYKALKRTVVHTGASTVPETENGRSHFKTDSSAVAVPNTLPAEFLCTIANYGTGAMLVTFADGVARLQGAADSSAHSVWSVAPWNTLNIWKVEDGAWLISGKAEAV